MSSLNDHASQMPTIKFRRLQNLNEQKQPLRRPHLLSGKENVAPSNKKAPLCS